MRTLTLLLLWALMAVAGPVGAQQGAPNVPVSPDGSAVQEQQNIARSGQHHRPLPEDPIAVLQRMSDARLPAYERLADITVDVAPDPQVTCDRVMQALQARE